MQNLNQQENQLFINQHKQIFNLLQSFKIQLYNNNKMYLRSKLKSRKNTVQEKSTSIFKLYVQKNKTVTIEQSHKYPHSSYAVYFPVINPIYFSDELTTKFAIMNDQFNKNLSIRQQIYKQIKNQHNITQSIRKFIGGLDIQKLFAYERILLKYGYTIFSKIFRQNQNGMQEDQLIRKIHKKNKKIKLNRQIYLCKFCLMYDCKIHKVQTNKVNNSYSNSTNLSKEDDHTYSMVQMLKFKKRLSMTNLSPYQSQYCTDTCYKTLTLSKYKVILELQKFNIFDKVIISKGIQIFSYNPCLLSLYVKQITCQKLFIYFIECLKIQQILERKFYKSQIQQLSNQTKYTQYSQKKSKIKKRRKKLKITTNFSQIQNYLCDCQEQCLTCNCHNQGYCHLECLCKPNCYYKRIGCNCIQYCEQNCPCKSKNIECDPEICKNCYNTLQYSKINKCMNNQIRLNCKQRLNISQATVCNGLGIFACKNIKANTLLGCYVGEYISQFTLKIRQEEYNLYNYQYRMGGMDAKYIGGKLRFINHTKSNANAVCQYMYSGSTYHLAIYATRQIKKHEQILVNYDQGNKLTTNFPNFVYLNQQS